ncbi:MAG: LysR family transcriptional regulator [Myxococcota bacterium]
MSRLNYHHLQYFWAVAKEGNLTRVAKRLHVSQSALSVQIRQLEAELGQSLFIRERRSLVLTEAGRIALAYAERIFSNGAELVSTLKDGRRRERTVLRIGAVATLSRNFQESFVKPLLARDDFELVLQSAGLDELISRLDVHALDLVLSNRSVPPDAERSWQCRRIARQPVSLVGQPRKRRKPFRFPDDLAGARLVLPGPTSDVRARFDLLCDRLEIRTEVLAEVDDMAMLRLLARDTQAIALVPSVVVRDELREGLLEEYCVVPDLHEQFYAITVKRHFQHPALKALLARPDAEMLESDTAR